MVKSVVKLGVVAATIGGVALFAQPAMALVSQYKDAGYSEDTNRQVVYACDTKKDGNGVYAKWKITADGNYNSVTNQQGNGTCNGSTNRDEIYGHQVWIDLSWRPDAYGPWVHY